MSSEPTAQWYLFFYWIKYFVNHIYRIHSIPTFPAFTPILGRVDCVTTSDGGGLLPMDQTQ